MTLGLALGGAAPLADAQAPASTTDDGAIAALIRDLGDASYEARTAAMLKLIAAGSKARAGLERAAAGNDVEQALRARRILQIFESLYFLDTKVDVSFTQSKVSWDEPAELSVTLTNESAFSTRVPFELDPAKSGRFNGDARQVAEMLDVGEWLHVFGPAGTQVNLKVDDIAKDAGVVQVVEERLSGGPTSLLKPGERVVVRIKDVNRGWARFPLLDAGEYTAFLEFIPAWNEESLAVARVGYVRSNTATITVGDAAPSTISRSGIEADVAVEREGGELVARLTNHDDLPVIVNTNFGGSIPLAQGIWAVEQAERRVEVPIAPERTWRDFSEKKLVEVEPGRAVELGRLDRAELAKAAKAAGIDLAQAVVSFTYSSFLERNWQEREGQLLAAGDGQADALRRPLPRRLLSTRQTSNAIPLGASP